jgi:hypothetical protein
MRGGRNPCVVDFNSSIEDTSGVVVPMPALPFEGKVFCANRFAVLKQKHAKKAMYIFFININFRNQK